jgi:hypothetical protein
MHSYEIEEKLETVKNNILRTALLEANALLAEVHHQLNIIEQESGTACQEYKNARKHLEQARNCVKEITI